MKFKVCFIGLGVMGYPMAGYLLRGGHDVTVFNRTRSRAEDWVAEHGGGLAETPSEAAAGCDFVFCCVGNDDDLRSVTLGEDGTFQSMKKGSVFVDHTTTSARVARDLAAEAKEKEFEFIDAPKCRLSRHGRSFSTESSIVALRLVGGVAAISRSNITMPYAKLRDPVL